MPDKEALPETPEKREEKPVEIRNEPERDLVVWRAAARPFKKRDREFSITVISISAVIGLILFFIEGWLPVAVVVSIVFLIYVLTTIAPEEIDYKITTRGIVISGSRNSWNTLGRFWFSSRFDSELLIVESANLAGRIEVVIDPTKKDEMTRELSRYLLLEEVPPSRIERTANWLSRRMSLGG